MTSADVARTGTVDWRSAQMQARIRKRYAKERRFRFLGLGALVFAAGFLLFLLTTIVSDGIGGFQRAEVPLDIEYSATTLGLDPAQMSGDGADYAINRADFRSLVNAAAEAQLGTSEMISEGAWLDVRDRLRDDPSLLGSRERVWVVAAPEVDLLAKGQISFDVPAQRRAVSQEMINQYVVLNDRGDVQLSLNTGFLTKADSTSAELAGIWGALLGSLLTMAITLALSFPIGVMTAVYLEEYAPRNRFTDMIEVSINNLAAVPSIIFGLLGLSVFLNTFGMPRSAPVVGGVTLALMTLPVIVIASRVSLQSVPPSIRDAALGIGASRLQVILHHILPVALPGILTGTIIGLSRALGETAPLLLIGMRAFVSDVPGGVTDPATALPVQIFLWSDEVGRGFVEKTSAAIMVLLAVLLSMNGVAIYLRNKFERRW
ncbi:phosphate ABC transporter permease PstA [Pacificimonas sp. ICDLI1SI03]